MKKIFLAALLLSSTAVFSQSEVNIIPKPQELNLGKGNFVINANTSITLKNTKESDIALFLNQLRKATNAALPLQNKKNNNISFEINKKLALPNADGYTLNVTEDKIEVAALNPVGLFHATQTLRQLLPNAIEGLQGTSNQNWQIPVLKVKDFPRYNWRGYMQDVSRTFYGVDVIKKYLDVMALYKMNTFHWHLTDDQGWRIEIKKYPKLTTEQTTVFHPTTNQPAARSGYYTQEQIKEVVAYAKERKINIVPEIDIPGHSWPTILAYPELGVNKNTYPNHIFPFVASWGYWGTQFTPNTLDPTKELVYDFLNDIFTEIATLFPGQYIHFGGDEVRHALWEKDEHILAFMQKNNLKSVTELQSYFVKRVSAIITSKGKKPLGWNDILVDAKNLPRETAIMSWLGAGAIKQAVENGFQSVATPAGPLYFDITQADRNDGTTSDLAYKNINSLELVYKYNPSAGLTEEQEKLVLGVQANQWTALNQELKDMNVHNFPRLLAVAEIGWSSQENKDFQEFNLRVDNNLPRLDSMRVDYYKPGGYITGTWTSADVSETFQELTFDVTKKVYTTGRIQAGFFFTSGQNFLEIDGVHLLEDGNIIAEDNHHALADNFRGTNKIKPFYYNFEVKNYNPKAKYTVKAKVRSTGGNDSNGNFTFNLSPYKPFSAVEPR